MKSPIRWAGGKTWLAPTIRRMIKETGSDRYIEPFAGGAGIAFDLEMPNTILNDTNAYLMAFYRSASAGFTPAAWDNNEHTYYNARDMLNRTDPRVSALLFYYLNRTSFNGLWRVNQQGKYNVPYGSTGWAIHKEPHEKWLSLSLLMKSWLMPVGSYKDLALDPMRGKRDFIYCDPPYLELFNDYTIDGFSLAANIELAEWGAASGSNVVISQTDNDDLIGIYKHHGYKVFRVQGRQRISADVETRGIQYEILATRLHE